MGSEVSLMALLWFDSCGDYWTGLKGVQAWDLYDVNATDPGRRGGIALEFSQSDDAWKWIAPTTTLYFGFAFKIPGFGAGQVLFFLRNQADRHLTFNTELPGILSVDRNTTFLVESAPGVMFANTWHYLEGRVTIDGSSGIVDIRIDGVQVINLTGANTQQGATTTIDIFEFNFGLGGVHMFMDDFWILDGNGGSPQDTFLGDVHVDILLPTGAGNASDFTPSAGSNWENVDDNPDDIDVTHNTTVTAADIDLYTYPALPTISGGDTVISVKVVALPRKLDGALAELKFLTRPVATDRFGADTFVLQTDYRYRFQLFDDNPETSAVWTTALIDAAEFGVQAQ